MQKPDMVNQPPHYQGDIECIDYIQQQLGDNFRYYLEQRYRQRDRGPTEEPMVRHQADRRTATAQRTREID